MKPVEKYKPQTARPVPWVEIEEHYRNLVEDYNWPIQSMLDLVRYIRRTHLEERLYAYTSHDELVVTIYDIPEWNREALHIHLDPVSLIWKFHYLPKPYESPEGERSYPEQEGISKFVKYIETLKW